MQNWFLETCRFFGACKFKLTTRLAYISMGYLYMTVCMQMNTQLLHVYTIFEKESNRKNTKYTNESVNIALF